MMQNQLTRVFTWLPALIVILAILTSIPLTGAPTKTEMVAMRDGTRLVTDIYLPEGTGPWPVVLARTPYGRGSDPKTALGVMAAVAESCAVVVQSMRGRFGSEGGENLVFSDDGWGRNQDGFDCLEWIARQPWCNGKMVSVGSSALGITQYLMLGSGTSRLQCAFVSVAPCSPYHGCFFQGGAFREELVRNWLKLTGFNPTYIKVVEEHPACDSLWKSMDLSTRFGVVKTPALHMGGWYDIFIQGTIDAFVGLQNQGGKGARGNQKLIILPSGHGLPGKIGEFEYPNPMPSNIFQHFQWFRGWLMDGKAGDDKLPSVTYYTMGAIGEEGAPGNMWNTSDVWPVPSKVTPLYFHKENQLLPVKPESKQGKTAYQFDPDNPVPTVGGNNLFIPFGPMDQRKVEERKDVILFTSKPLDAPMEITGPIKVKLWASSSAKDTDFTAKLTDVYPDGRSMLVCDGIIRARYRESFEKPKLLETGKIYEFEIDLGSTSLIVNKGHCIRVAISSSNTPRFDVNPNTGEPVFKAAGKITATNTLYFNSIHPSAIYLPVVGK